jgi:hypothetical protein
MAQVNTTISDKLNELLDDLSSLTGISKSSLIAEYVRRGIYEDVGNEAKLAEFKAIIAQYHSSPAGTPETGSKGGGKAGGKA